MTTSVAPKATADTGRSLHAAAGGSVTALRAVAVVVVVVAGLVCLAMPFSGDQAQYAVYARQLSDGAVLYRDVFDVKQPGIFVFYALGGLLFGFTEVGIHLLELGYWLAFAGFAFVALRRYFATWWAAPLVPVLTVAVYYLYAQPHDLTQNEMLVAFPLLVAWWLVDGAVPGTRRGVQRFAAAGVVAAVVVLLKHLYLVIVAAFVVYAVVRALRARVALRTVAPAVAAFGVGLVLPLLAVVGYFAAHGQLERIWWAYFELAPGGTSLAPRPFSRLTGGVTTFLLGYAAIVVLAAVGGSTALREGTKPQRELATAMGLWLLAGVPVFLVQYWLAYHWLLFVVPLGILAVLGVEALARSARSLRGDRRGPTAAALAGIAALSLLAGAPGRLTLYWAGALVAVGVAAALAFVLAEHRPAVRLRAAQLMCAAVAVAVGWMLVTPVDKVAALAEHDFALGAQARADLQRAWYSPYQAADADLAVVSGGDPADGPWYVFGNPVVLLRADRDQAAALSGWFAEIYDDRAWRELHDDLRVTMPPYIIVEPPLGELIRRRSPAMAEFLAAEYAVSFEGASGTWYTPR